MRTLLIYSKDWRDEATLRLYKAFTVLLQKQRAYALEKIAAKSPARALVFTYPCGWHGDVLFIAPYVVAVGPFEKDAILEFVLALPDRVALTLLEGGWTIEEVFKEFGPFDIGVACVGAPVKGVRRYVHKMVIIKVEGPVGDLISTLYAPEEEEADEVITAPP
ncbi:hypothetical protein PAE2791 [Pyrobaculum aerophilum str. IM2]|uniref:Uncharacterized protein n=3 Tax=Pyrobaculum aerophilum TaxID=13773 RepID=Q8ZUG9_PYRAE|nr:hypothetical protein [Pyrobaculum aerophilum]AAL64438.1 hypothetical protein PAE2791 [Pyrobaculum aerophilum str. IM2]HII47296.1 hypothetical protein [Pyrobaculum aerophilum]